MTTIRSEARREIFALCLIAAAIFFFVALLTYREGPGPVDGGGVANLCGRVGEFFAGFFLHNFGYASWLLVLCLGFWGVASFVGRQLNINSARLIGLWALLLVSSTSLSHLFQGGSSSLPDPGGYVGLYLNHFLVDRVSLGLGGTRILLLLMTLITLILATDWLFVNAISNLVQTIRERREAQAAKGDDAGDEEWEEGEWEDEEWEEEDGEWEEGEWDESEWSDGETEEWDEKEEEARSPGIAPATAAFLGRIGRGFKAVSAFFAGRTQGSAVADNDDCQVDPDQEFEDEVGEEADVAAEYEDGTSEEPEVEEAEEPAKKPKRKRKSRAKAKAEEPEVEDGIGSDIDGLVTEAESFGGVEDEPVPRTPAPRKKAKTSPRRSKKQVEEEAPVPPVQAPPVIEASSASEGMIDDDLLDDIKSDGDPVKIEPPAIHGDKPYVFPPLDLLEDPEPVPLQDLERHIKACGRVLEETLVSFKIEGHVVANLRGPVITMYEVALKPGTKVDRLRSIEDELAMALKARNVRIVAPLPGKSTVGIEVPNLVRETVRMKELFETKDFKKKKMAIPILLGKDASGRPLIDDLAQMPHMLVAGSTGSGKSVCLNAIIMSILFSRSPEQTKLILIDPKMVELSVFQNIAHLMCPVVTDMRRAATILDWAVEKMESRYELLARVGVRNIYSYNSLGRQELEDRLQEPLEEGKESMPFIVIIVDELADLMMAAGKEVEAQITRLAQKSRAVGIHVVLATQRPSTNVITGLIKANMPTRISFMVASKIDSRVILDTNGAEKLLGAGDMLYVPPRSSRSVRAQSSFVDDHEIRDVVQFIRDNSAPEYSKDLIQTRTTSDQDPAQIDDLWTDAVEYVLETRRGSASLLQRRFKIGYTRASRLIDMMANAGILGEYKGSQAREVLCSMEEWNERKPEQTASLDA